MQLNEFPGFRIGSTLSYFRTGDYFWVEVKNEVHAITPDS